MNKTANKFMIMGLIMSTAALIIAIIAFINDGNMLLVGCMALLLVNSLNICAQLIKDEKLKRISGIATGVIAIAVGIVFIVIIINLWSLYCEKTYMVLNRAVIIRNLSPIIL